ncbi:MAG: efflux RND transporter periplasmic adaptor subunit [Deltaproteobacteria bacterium]|jgi:HlyD family secretion protein|nr:efflux RND transporter periplasmic adaptor subunit [Deltaproteobacteria bacterium]
MRKFLVFALLLALAGAGYVYLLLPGREKGAERQLLLYGNVDVRELSLAFRVGGRLHSAPFEEGDRIAPGDVAAILDQKPFLDEVNLRKAQVREVEAGVAYAMKTFERMDALRNKGTISQSDHDNALAERDIALASLDTVRAQLSIAETALADAALISPAGGTVLTKFREAGEMVGAGDPVFALSIDDPVWVRAYVDEPDLGKIFPGQKALVKTDSGSVLEGQIGFVSPKAEFTPKSVETESLRSVLVYRLRVVVKTNDGTLRQGMPVTVIPLGLPVPPDSVPVPVVPPDPAAIREGSAPVSVAGGPLPE